MSSRFFTKKRFRTWAIVFLLFTLLGLVNFKRFVTNELAEYKPPRYQYYFIMETTGAYTLLILVPVIVWFIKKVPISRKNRSIRIPVHILASMGFGACHTLLMYSSRVFIFWILGLGAYMYGRFEYRFPMEYSN